MKKNAILFFASLTLIGSLSLTSCKKEDEKKDEKKSIVGSWTSMSATGKTVVDGVTTLDMTVPLADQIEYTLNSDNTFSAVDRTESPIETESGTYSISGSTLYSTSTKGEKDTTEFEITVDDKMIIKDNDSYTKDGKAYVENNSITFKRK
jgi:hypothetical protein